MLGSLKFSGFQSSRNLSANPHFGIQNHGHRFNNLKPKKLFFNPRPQVVAPANNIHPLNTNHDVSKFENLLTNDDNHFRKSSILEEIRNDLQSSLDSIKTNNAVNLHPNLESNLERILNYNQPTEIQKIVWSTLNPSSYVESHIIASRTGTGKTLAYLIAIFNDILYKRDRPNQVNSNSTSFSPRAIIIVPTNFLVDQVYNIAKSIAFNYNIDVIRFTSIASQSFSYRNVSNSDILITTPIASIIHLRKNIYKTDFLRYLVLDDVDNSRFDTKNDITHEIVEKSISKNKYINHCSSIDRCQILFVSSTFSDTTTNHIYKCFPKTNIISTPDVNKLPTRLKLEVRLTPTSSTVHRLATCIDILKENCAKFKIFLIFCNGIQSAENLTNHLKSFSYNAKLISSKLSIGEQAEVAKLLTTKVPNALLPSDPPIVYISSGIFSFGLDTLAVDYVVLYDPPKKRNDLLNKVGRVARSRNTGHACIIISSKEEAILRNVVKYKTKLLRKL